jgi:ATP/maltotriose-dependent transcriptional regulator MalT
MEMRGTEYLSVLWFVGELHNSFRKTLCRNEPQFGVFAFPEELLAPPYNERMDREIEHIQQVLFQQTSPELVSELHLRASRWYEQQGLFAEAVSHALAAPAPPSHLLVELLTGWEREVLQLLLDGASNREIAHKLVVSMNTVKKHVSNICGKLSVHSRTQVIAKARTFQSL